MQIFENVTNGIHQVSFPQTLHCPVEAFIKGLCQQSPSKRLPMKKDHTKKIKEHEWLRDFQWDKVFTFDSYDDDDDDDDDDDEDTDN